MALNFPNPFRPGAGQLPPHLAGRNDELDYFEQKSLQQNPILSNLIISGLRGVGKTVLLDTLRPLALQKGWLWAGTDLSEAASVNEKRLSTRILTDLASTVSSIAVAETERRIPGFGSNNEIVPQYLNYQALNHIYETTPGLEADKLKRVLELTWEMIHKNARGIILAYDEAQNLTDNAEDKEYPLSLLLEIIQYLQRKEMPYLLILTGLPTLFSNLVEARTYSERMFHQMILDRLTGSESREAIVIPIKRDNCPVRLHDDFIEKIITCSGGYPYFIQYICKETYDSYLQQVAIGKETPVIILDDIIRKLDTDFYQGRWNRITDRQRELLTIISTLENAEEEFTIKEIEEASQKTDTPFKTSPINLMLKTLTASGLIYKNRHGRYSFAVPMFSKFIIRELGQ